MSKTKASKTTHVNNTCMFMKKHIQTHALERTYATNNVSFAALMEVVNNVMHSVHGTKEQRMSPVPVVYIERAGKRGRRECAV